MHASWKTFGLLLVLGTACSDSGRTELSPLAQQGQRVYQNVCIACHNGDPTKDGSAGPAIAGSSRELIEARVLRASYPPGYTPKRPGNAMPPFPYLAKDIDALAAYLGEVGKTAAPTG
ncbi:MAG TPA: cytochrome c [Myxococcota bacterium]|nr:cytochrome c [Myxococcota bacterium]